MKRLINLLALAVIASAISASAQLSVFNHLGADLSLSTNGIDVEVSSPITDFVQMRAGLSFMPGFKFKANVDGKVDVNFTDNLGNTYTGPQDFDMKLHGSLARTQGSVIFNVYPFGRVNSLYVAAGAYFGGKAIVKLKGHSDKIADLQQGGHLNEGYVEIGKYQLEFEKNGNIRGGLCANTFRPYLGVGYGRPCPGRRLGFMVEAGVQFMGHMKVCQGKKLKPLDTSDIDNNDDWQKWMNKLTVYPVIKFSLTGRIL